MKKRIISLLLCVVLLIGLLPTTALATPISDGDRDVLEDIQAWTDEDAKVRYGYRVYQAYQEGESEPAVYYASISWAQALDGFSAATLSLPDTLPFNSGTGTSTNVDVKVIDNLFRDQGWPANLTSVTLPEKVQIINGGFYNSKLTGIAFPAALESIGDDAFKFSTLQSITFAEGSQLKSIGANAFYGCDLTGVTFPNSLESIGASAFYQNDLTGVTFGSGLKTLGAGAFRACYGLRTVNLEATQLTAIPENAFRNCALTSVTLPDTVTAIGKSAFFAQGAAYNELSGTTLTSLDLGGRETSQLQTIGAEAFSGNRALTGTLSLPNSVREIGRSAFSSCGFTDIQWPENNEDFNEVNGFDGCVNLPGSVVSNLPFTVTTIGASAFSGCTGMTEVTIPYYVTTIGEQAFSRSGVSDLTIAPGSDLVIGKGAFLSCTGLLGKTIDLPARVTQLYSGAFGQIIAEDNNPKMTVNIRSANIEFVPLAEEEKGGSYDYPHWSDEEGMISGGADPFSESVNLELHAPADCNAATAYAAKWNNAYARLRRHREGHLHGG